MEDYIDDDEDIIELSIDDMGGQSLIIDDEGIMDESIEDIDDMSLDIIDEQSIEDDIIMDDESIIDDELLWARLGMAAAAIEPAARSAAMKASCFFMMGSVLWKRHPT